MTIKVTRRCGTFPGPDDGRDDAQTARTPKTRETISHFLSELENPAKRLTAWETNFIESITDQFDRRGTLSDKQFEILERIYAEKTA